MSSALPWKNAAGSPPTIARTRCSNSSTASAGPSSTPRKPTSTRRAPTTASTSAGSPEDPTAWKRGIVWQVQVQPAEGEPWVQEFGLHTPSEAIAAFLTALIATPQPLTALPTTVSEGSLGTPCSAHQPPRRRLSLPGGRQTH
ncbi:DUF317 domain-containing protein [Streptomyces sp. NPDC005492]|uniref:DUF317 domain-containing protein n=1 Tax=Streptomyces sp. NPDC005492 TaxID=3156883 RepID=UPI0033A162B3